jgi:hypothetical protein
MVIREGDILHGDEDGGSMALRNVVILPEDHDVNFNPAPSGWTYTVITIQSTGIRIVCRVFYTFDTCINRFRH